MSQILVSNVPLTASERETCSKLGVSEEDYRAARDLPAAEWNSRCASESAKLVPVNGSMTASELATIRAVGVSEADYLAERDRLNAVAAGRQTAG